MDWASLCLCQHYTSIIFFHRKNLHLADRAGTATWGYISYSSNPLQPILFPFVTYFHTGCLTKQMYGRMFFFSRMNILHAITCTIDSYTICWGRCNRQINTVNRYREFPASLLHDTLFFSNLCQSSPSAVANIWSVKRGVTKTGDSPLEIRTRSNRLLSCSSKWVDTLIVFGSKWN